MSKVDLHPHRAIEIGGKRLRAFFVTPEELMQVLTGEARATNIPADATLVNMGATKPTGDFIQHGFYFWLESQEFPPLVAGECLTRTRLTLEATSHAGNERFITHTGGALRALVAMVTDLSNITEDYIGEMNNGR